MGQTVRWKETDCPSRTGSEVKNRKATFIRGLRLSILKAHELNYQPSFIVKGGERVHKTRQPGSNHSPSHRRKRDCQQRQTDFNYTMSWVGFVLSQHVPRRFTSRYISSPLADKLLRSNSRKMELCTTIGAKTELTRSIWHCSIRAIRFTSIHNLDFSALPVHEPCMGGQWTTAIYVSAVTWPNATGRPLSISRWPPYHPQTQGNILLVTFLLPIP